MLQLLLDIVYRYTNRWKFEVNESKYNIVVFNKPKHDSLVSLIIGDTYIFETDHAVHLGIRQDASLKLTNRIKERCQEAKMFFLRLPI